MDRVSAGGRGPLGILLFQLALQKDVPVKSSLIILLLSLTPSGMIKMSTSQGLPLALLLCLFKELLPAHPLRI